MIVNFPRETMVQEQKKVLISQLEEKAGKWLLAKSSHYKKILTEEFGYLPSLEQLLTNWSKVPVTRNLPQDSFSLLTGPLSTTLRFNKNTRGQYMALSQRDLGINLDMTIRALAAQNINNTSIVALCGDYQRGHILDLHYGVEALGATVLPCGNREELEAVMEAFHPDTVIGQATVGEYLENKDYNCPKFLLLTNSLDLQCPAHYQPLYVNPLTDQVGLIFLCEEGHYHLQEDYCKWEIAEGELVFTPLTLEAMPLLKVATGVKVQGVKQELCNCGRTLAQLKLI